MKRLFKWLLILLLLLLLLVAAALGVSWVLAGTDGGFRFATRQLDERIEGLQISEPDGNLSHGISTREISFGNAAMSVQARGIDAAWRAGCLLRAAFCLDRLVVNELVIETFAADEPEARSIGDIALPTIKLPIDLTATDILIKTLRFQPPGDAPVQELTDVSLSATTQGNRLHIDTLSTQYQNYTVSARGDMQLKGDYPLDMVVNLDAQNVVDEQDLTGTVTLGGSLRELQIAADVKGAVNVHLQGRLQALKQKLPATLTLASTAAGWPLDTMTQVKATDVSLVIDGNMDDYRISLDTHLGGEQIPDTQLSLAGFVNPQRLLLPDLSILTLQGAITGDAAVSFQDKITWLSNLTIKNINPAVKYPDITGQLNGRIKANGSVENGQWTLTVDHAEIDGVIRQYPLKLDVVVSKSLDDEWLVDTLTLENGNNNVAINGRISDTWDLQAKLKLPQLQNLWPGLAGGFDADINMAGKLANPDIDLQAAATVVKFNDLLVQNLSMQATIDQAALRNSKLILSASQINSGTQKINNATITLDGTRAEHRLKLFADGPQKTSVDLLATGGLDQQNNWLGKLQQVTLEIPAHKITLRKPTTLAWKAADKKFSVDPHCWVSLESSICLQNQVLAEASGHAEIALEAYALERLNLFLPANSTLKGTLSTDATVLWGKEQPGGFNVLLKSAIDAGSVSVTDDNDTPAVFDYNTLTLDADINASRIDTRLTVSSTSMGDATVSFSLDPADEDKSIEGQVDMTGFDISFVQAFVPQFDEISGIINASGKIDGSLTDPRFNGEIVLENPVVRADILPLEIVGGQITTVVKGKRAFLDGELDTGVSAAGDGRLVLEGSANWQQVNWRADVMLDGENLSIVLDPVVESAVFPRLQVSAQPGQLRVTGNIDIPSARIEVADIPKGAVNLSDDVIIIEDIELTRARTAAVSANKLNLIVAVDVSLGDDVDLSAYGLTASLTGDMNVAIKGPNPPQLGGEIKVYEGIFKQYGQNLKADGQVLFIGPVDQSRLDIKAIRDIDGEDRVAGLHIQGNVGAPEINLFTEPADKPQESILSYIVLGRDIGDTSDQNANLLASAALALTVKGGRTIGSDVAESLGIEEFALETSGQGDDTQLVVSGRLNDRLLLRYGHNVFESGVPTLYLRYDITRKLYLEAAQGAEKAVDLFYSFSF
jgi:translocation and assembly module TamB